MVLFSKEFMLEHLQQGKCEVFFQKKNGTIRHMICTLNPNEVPKFYNEKIIESSQIQQEDNLSTVLPVWDVEKEGWRSFRIASVLSFKLHENITQLDDI